MAITGTSDTAATFEAPRAAVQNQRYSMLVRLTLKAHPRQTDHYSVERLAIRDGVVWLEPKDGPPYQVEPLEAFAAIEVDNDGGTW